MSAGIKRKHSPAPASSASSNANQSGSSIAAASTGPAQRPRYFAQRPPGQPPVGRVAGFVKPVPFSSSAVPLTLVGTSSGSQVQTYVYAGGSGPLRDAVHVPFTLQKPPEQDSSARGSAASSAKNSRPPSRTSSQRGASPSFRQLGVSADVDALSGLGQALSGLDLKGKAAGSRRSSRASSISLS